MHLNGKESVGYLSDLVAEKEITLISEPESIFGPARKYPKAGTVRPGIKVPYKNGKHVLTAEEAALYTQRMQEQVPPHRIEKELGKGLRTTNVPYFSIYPSECAHPESAGQIKDLYGDSDGKIRRLKIVFVSDKWWEYLPHNLAAYKASGCFCRSELVKGKLIATRDPEDGHSGEKRQFPCIPGKCPIYQKKDCRLSGILKFMILGIPGTGLWQLPTHSEISLSEIHSDLKRLNEQLKERGQNIVGLTFELYKQEAWLSIWDEEAKKRVRKRQWLIKVCCPEIPMADLMSEKASFPLGQNKPGKEIQISEGASQHEPAFKEDTVPDAKTIRRMPEENVKTIEKGDEEAMRLIYGTIVSSIAPNGNVPLAVVEDHLKSVKKSHFNDLSLEEAQALEHIVQHRAASHPESLQKEKTGLPEMTLPKERHVEIPDASLF